MTSTPIRIATIADLHVRTRDDMIVFAEAFATVSDQADMLLIAGDLTDLGRVAEMEIVAEMLDPIDIPVFVTYGNHDRRGMRRSALTKVLRSAGVTVLDGSGALVTLADGRTVGIAGVVGTGGGFRPDGEEFGPGGRFTRAAMVRSRRESARLRKILRDLRDEQPDVVIVMSHFSPTTSTLGDEPPLKYWMLGNALLGRTIDEFAPALVIHGHAHLGNELGVTDGGVPVVNVALPVTGGIRILELDEHGVIDPTALVPIEMPFNESRVRESDVR